jgi:SepF-like predicted cell division protein (DUF552 family)
MAGDRMGIFDKIFGKEKETDEPDLGQYLEMEAEGDVVNPPADFYVKRIDLRNEGDANLALKELASKNIIIVNVMPLAKQPNRLKGIIGKLKVTVEKMNGDIALLTQELVMLTPSKVKIVKSKQKPAPEKM